MRPYRLALFILTLLLLSSCADLADEDQVQVGAEATAQLDSGHSVGQTFVSHHAGLNGIEVYLSPSADARGTIRLHLRKNPGDSSDITTTEVRIEAGSQRGFYHFRFGPLSGSHTRYYYAFLEYEGTGGIEVPAGRLYTYNDGVLYSGHEPSEMQMVFRLHYERLSIVLDLLLAAGRWIAYGMGILTILFFSGYWIARKWTLQRDFSATLVISVVGFLASWMVFLVWARTFGVFLKASSVRLLVGLSALTGLIVFATDTDRWSNREFWLSSRPLMTLGLWAVIILSVALRLFVGRSVVALPGSDTYHQTLIAQLFKVQGGIPHSYQPYAPLQSYSYHFGFHSLVAFFRWLLRSDLLITTKNVALILNGAIAGVVGLLAEEATRRRRGGIIGAALVGLIAVSPFCLLQYGRFTQTTGLLLLTFGAWILVAGREQPPNWILPSLIVAAITYSHYRAALYWAVLAIIIVGREFLDQRWDGIRPWMISGVSATVLVAPWLLNVAWTQSDPYGLQAMYPYLDEYHSIARLGETVLSFPTNRPLVIVLLPAIGLAALKGHRRRVVLYFAAWCLLLGGGAALSALAGFYFWDIKTMLLSLPIPLAVLISLGAESAWDIAEGRDAMLHVAIGGAIIVGIAVGVLNLPSLIRSGPVYLRPGDLVTMDWIRDNLPSDAFVLTNGIEFDWSPGWIVGADAGYWTPLLTGRDTTPPAMTYRLEWGPSTHWFAPFEALHKTIIRNTDERAPSKLELSRNGITHIFANARQGFLRPHVLDEAPYLRPIYRQDTTWIFEVTD